MDPAKSSSSSTSEDYDPTQAGVEAQAYYTGYTDNNNTSSYEQMYQNAMYQQYYQYYGGMTDPTYVYG